MLPPRTIYYPAKSLVPGMRNLLSSCCSVKSEGAPQAIQSVVVSFGCPPENENESIFLKTPCTVDTTLTIQATSDLKASSLWISFHRVRIAGHLPREGSSQKQLVLKIKDHVSHRIKRVPMSQSGLLAK